MYRQAEAKLSEIVAEVAAEVLAEVDPAPQPMLGAASVEVVTFGQICREYLTYVKNIRKVRTSTLVGYRNEIERVLIPAFGEHTPAESIDPDR